MKSRTLLYLLIVLAISASFILPACGPAVLKTPEPVFTPTIEPAVQVVPKVLTVLQRQSPTILNPHFSRNVKDLEPSRVVYEPLASFNNDGVLVPLLATEIPSILNGDLAQDGKSVTWRLRQDVRWSDGQNFTADDVVFTYNFITDPEVKAVTASNYGQIASVEAPDKFTVKITFKDVNPTWAVPFVGNGGVILPRHIFEPYQGAKASESTINIIPVGTGPYLVKEPGIKPQEVLLLGSQVVKTTKIVFEPNPYYRFPEQIAFQRIIWRGGGSADEAARRSLQMGDVDLAYDLDLVDPVQLAKLLDSSDKGKLISLFGGAVERLLLNRTSPFIASASGEYSSLEVPHPVLSDKKIRQAIAHAIDREAIAKLYGEMALPTEANLVAPPQYKSSNIFYEYDLAKARALLAETGCVDSDGDTYLEKDGTKLKLVLQSAVGTIQSQIQQIIKNDLNNIGIDVELKTVDSSIMFGSGASNPDADTRFSADMMIFRYRSSSPDPSIYMKSWTCAQIPQQANEWKGLNDERWCNKAYDALLQQAINEFDAEKRASLYIQLNDMLIEDVVMIPMVWRAVALGANKNLMGINPTPWDSISWNINEWHFDTP